MKKNWQMVSRVQKRFRTQLPQSTNNKTADTRNVCELRRQFSNQNPFKDLPNQSTNPQE
jgi:hypothetical protein